MGSLAHGHGQPAAVQAAYIDVITEHFNSEMSSDDAVEKMAESVVRRQRSESACRVTV